MALLLDLWPRARRRDHPRSLILMAWQVVAQGLHDVTLIFWVVAAATILLTLSRAPRTIWPTLIVCLLILLIVLGAGEP